MGLAGPIRLPEVFDIGDILHQVQYQARILSMYRYLKCAQQQQQQGFTCSVSVRLAVMFAPQMDFNRVLNRA